MQRRDPVPEYKSEYFKDPAMPYVEVRYVLHSAKHYKPHFHDTFSFGVIEEGEVEFFHDEQRSNLRTGELIAFNPEAVHACNPVKDKARSYHMIYLDVGWCKAFQENMWHTTLGEFVPVDRVTLSDAGLYRDFLALSVLLRDRTVFYLEKEEILYQFMHDFFEKFIPDHAPDDLSENASEQHMENAKTYIKDQVCDNITVAQIAQEVSLSEYHFIRLFKQHTGLSPHAYLLNQKIILAQRLLMRGIPIAEVAQEVGFVDQSHLSRHFQAIVAMTPGEFVRASGMRGGWR